MNNTVDKHTPGPWEMKAAKWTNDPAEPIWGFSIQSGDKKICGLNVVINSRIMPDEYFKNFPDFHREHFTSEEAEANAALIASAPTLKKENEELKERNRVLVEALGQLVNRIESNWEAITSGNQNGVIGALLKEAKEALQSNQ